MNTVFFIKNDSLFFEVFVTFQLRCLFPNMFAKCFILQINILFVFIFHSFSFTCLH